MPFARQTWTAHLPGLSGLDLGLLIAREVHATLAATEVPIGDASPEALARVSQVHARRMAESLRGRLPDGCDIAVRVACLDEAGKVSLLDE